MITLHNIMPLYTIKRLFIQRLRIIIDLPIVVFPLHFDRIILKMLLLS